MKLTTKLKLVLAAVLFLLVFVFTAQNAGAVDVKFLGWKTSISLALVIFGALAAGLVGGWAVTSGLRWKQQAQKK